MPCTRKSLVYENICTRCNPGAGEKKELRRMNNPDIPSLYVGETARTIKERAGEHWAAYRGGAKAQEGSHLFKHQQLHHAGESPLFMMRAVGFYKSALSRQTAEAVRIMRRGGDGTVLNSRSEFNRCYIPRLKVEDEDLIKEIEKEELKMDDAVREDLRVSEEDWIRNK